MELEVLVLHEFEFDRRSYHAAVLCDVMVDDGDDDGRLLRWEQFKQKTPLMDLFKAPVEEDE